ncbi:hypothetical protein A1O1_01917 [Capronia coronata CBS 617.96]|uniref:BZIP domain-containing protein n=1 Tax=Capronia coronata CBS 617.96 TaxID=1182541 RepID=W9YV19_9EURO|nr:uncharacterized protein A1O1_01917 [Capronia coronata CBS 617.96]EXJ93525.1 hypothetical protein A1O1_01917 [Capronia coronata CBS 617.96]
MQKRMLVPGVASRSDGRKGWRPPFLIKSSQGVTRLFQLTWTDRTHRDRKATYVKTLEAEVARLRARDAAHDAEIQAYKQTVHRLKQLISHHSGPLPPDLATDPLVATPQAVVELVGLPDHSQAIRAQMPEGYYGDLCGIAPAPALSSESTVSSTDFLAGMNISDGPRLDQAATLPMNTTISASMPHPQGLGTTQVGVDFVLALEQVCLSHHALHTCDEDGSGHSMMLTSPIMSRSPPLTQTTQPGTGLPDGTRWSVPAVELEKLLEFSNRLNLTGEITPVEAWQRIRRHPNFIHITRDGIETIKANLAPEVQCQGFGAIIDETYFEQVVQKVLGPHPKAF